MKKCLNQPVSLSTEALKIGEKALLAMMLELSATPKPGLVDRLNNGSHKDMNYEMFLMSISSIAPYFSIIAQSAMDNDPEESEDLLPEIRETGLMAEKKMFRATKGVNTQKGIIFLLGLTSAAAGALTLQNKPLTPSLLSDFIKDICKNIVKNELEPLKEKKEEKMTSGERLYLEYGIEGIRGEVSRGLPAVLNYGLPALKEGLREGLSLNDASLHSLCHIMAHLDDTALLGRHNMKILKKVRKEMNDFILRGGFLGADLKDEWERMDEEYNSEGINPGGSADMLAVSLMFYFLEKGL